MAKKILTSPGTSRTTPTRHLRSAANHPHKEHLSDLEIARRIQAALIPRSLPAAEGVDLQCLYLPSQIVGGDLFDVVMISEDVLAFLMFDVSGHGVSSALIASMAKAAFLNHVRQVTSPRSVLERVNEEMAPCIGPEHHVSAFVAYLDLHNNRLVYSNAGHTPPLLFHKESDAVSPLTGHGLFIGVFPGAYYEEKTLFLSPGDWLLLFSNGLHGIFDPGSESQGARKLEAAFHAAVEKMSPTELLVMFREKSREQAAGGHAINDDVGVIAAEILTQSRKNLIKTRLGFVVSEPVYLQFINYFEDMDRATGAILREMDELGYPDDGIRKMKISLTELLANAIYHGNEKDHAKKVTIGHAIDKAHVKVSIMDEGEGFDINTIPDPTLPENLEKDRGRGLFIVRNYVDALEFNEDGNRVSITKLNKIDP